MSSFISTPEGAEALGCTTCVFGAFEINQEPCMTCDRTSTKEIPYPLWLLDPSCGSDDGGPAPTSSGMLPRQQRIGQTARAEAVSRESSDRQEQPAEDDSSNNGVVPELLTGAEPEKPKLSRFQFERIFQINQEIQKINGDYNYRYISESQYIQRTDEQEAELRELVNTVPGTKIEIDYESRKPIKVNGESIQAIIDRQRKLEQSSISTTTSQSRPRR